MTRRRRRMRRRRRGRQVEKHWSADNQRSVRYMRRTWRRRLWEAEIETEA
jgi:hypothetical protein